MARKKSRRSTRILLWMCVVGMLGLIYYFSSQDSALSSQLSRRFSDIVIRLWPIDWSSLTAAESAALKRAIALGVRKAAHVIEFMTLGFLVKLLMSAYALPLTGLLTWCFGTGSAAVDEWHQTMVSGRAGQWQDVCLDSAGVLTGVIVAVALSALIARHRRVRPSTSRGRR